ncbi:TetR/AcrR family transcriptional regulator, partial [Pyxidicoccus fallax]
VGSFYRRYGSKAGFARQVRQWAETELCRIARVDFELAPERPERGFREVFDSFWEDLAWCATRKPELFHFTFMHWHPDSLEPEALGAQARELVREVLAHGEREGALAPGSVQVGEGLIWGALAELVRAVARGDEQDALENVRPMGRVLWKALAAEEAAGPRGSGAPPPDGATEDSEMGGTGRFPSDAAMDGSGMDGAGRSPLEAGATEDSGFGDIAAAPPRAATLRNPGVGGVSASSPSAAAEKDGGARATMEDSGAGCASAAHPGAATPGDLGVTRENFGVGSVSTAPPGVATNADDGAGGTRMPLSGAATMQGFGARDVGTPLSDTVSTVASGAHSSETEELGTRVLSLPDSSCRGGTLPPSRGRARSSCAVRRPGQRFSRRRRAPCDS